MNDFAPIEQLTSALLAGIAPPARRKLLATIARDVRKSQSDRIAAQRNPDGRAFEPRKAKPATLRKGQLRQKRMFTRLRLARHLKAGADRNEAWIGFTGRASRIASIHQGGGMDAPNKAMRQVRYARRILLGLSERQRASVMDTLLYGILDR